MKLMDRAIDSITLDAPILDEYADTEGRARRLKYSYALAGLFCLLVFFFLVGSVMAVLEFGIAGWAILLSSVVVIVTLFWLATRRDEYE